MCIQLLVEHDDEPKAIADSLCNTVVWLYFYWFVLKINNVNCRMNFAELNIDCDQKNANGIFQLNETMFR